MSCTVQVKVLLLFGGMMIFVSQKAQAQTQNIIGTVSQEELLSRERIYDIYAQRYKPEKEALDFLKSYTDTVKVKVFFGNWCRESKKYVPRLIKIFQLLRNDYFEIEYIGVGEQKKLPKEFLKKFHIKYIPTVLVLEGSDELGRIKEISQYRIETELVRILKKVQ
ncbi:MAG: hypothetical protein FH748_05740 [Balneolaceae bacterium]|nr:hypothetical protein [Balneolaceae bacterium]